MNNFMKATQFALTEYICVSSEDGCPSDDDIIHASTFGVFHSHVIFYLTDLFHILSANLNYILF